MCYLAAISNVEAVANHVNYHGCRKLAGYKVTGTRKGLGGARKSTRICLSGGRV